ncbi:MAG: hypothetical protein WD825_11775 [Gemmatimonadaceae bacterium]
MPFFTTVLLLQLALPARQSPPVLAFPEPGLDDSASYQGYQTRFFRDAAENTVQIYLDGRSGRVVHLWADADNASAGFTARDAAGHPAIIGWASSEATVSARVTGARRTRTLTYRLDAGAPHIHIGWFLLGSMRVERDFQYWGKHREPFASPAFVLPEWERLLAAIGRLPAAEQQRHLASLGASSVQTLRTRLQPTITTRATNLSWVARVVQPSLDGRDTLGLEIRADPRRVVARRVGDSLSLRARSGDRVQFTVSISTTAKPLTPLSRAEIFSAEFLDFLVAARRAAQPDGRDSASIRARWLERQVRGVELLSSREKFMAGLPAYATYFGRDMLLSALMMRPIWRDEVSEFVVASVLRKLSPSGQVSHEEALGGQAVREAAQEYAQLVDAHLRAAQSGSRVAADTLIARAFMVLRDHRRVRENYNMIDDEFQLPVLAARWLADPDVPATRKRAFLLDASDGNGTRLDRLVRELAFVARLSAPYAANPVASNLVSFPQRDSGWASASWRDSNAGYAGGRYAMDINTIWVPHALESIGRIVEIVRSLGFSIDSLGQVLPELGTDTPLGRLARDASAMRAARIAWWGTSRHFLVRLGPADVRSRVASRLAAMPQAEREYWTGVLARSGADQDSLTFLALALDARAEPIGVANSDPATRLFLGASEHNQSVLRDVRLFVRSYPVGLFVEGVGPVVANDAYASPAVWRAFERDHYHGPRVVWGREVNLFLLGVGNHIAASNDPAHVSELRSALATVIAAVEASGFQSELWSYEVRGGRIAPIRYGTGSDVQLWSTTDLAVQFMLSRLR